jgi:uncharacterized protein YjdB
MKKINKFLFLMFGFGAAACFVACGSDSDDTFEDAAKEVALSQNSITLLLNEEEGHLSASPLVEGYSATDVVWTNSNPSVADYDPTTGIVTAKGVGKTTLSARLKGRLVVSNCYVTVSYVKVTGLSLDKYEINMMRSDSDSIAVTILPANACYKNVKWESSNPSVVKVDKESGKLWANPDKNPLLNSGTATITATTVDQGIKAQCIVNVGQFSGVKYPQYPEKQQW